MRCFLIMSAVASQQLHFNFALQLRKLPSSSSPLAILTVNFQLNDLSNARANAVVGLAQVEALAILLDVLQQHGTVAEQLGEGTFAHLFVFA